MIRRHILAGAVVAAAAAPLAAQHERVADTVHNLSASGPGAFRSLTEPEVCKFCHVPHSAAVPEALWSRRLSSERYETPEIRRGRPGAQPAPQPDGSSRLCLSCHDGTIALGDVVGEPEPIQMAGRGRLGPGDRGFLGTDLSGSHPVSIAVTDSPSDFDDDSDMSLRPLGAIRGDPDIRLDAAGKMQCSTCHDPHSDRFFVPGRVPRFWVKPTLEEVCLTCHVPR